MPSLQQLTKRIPPTPKALFPRLQYSVPDTYNNIKKTTQNFITNKFGDLWVNKDDLILHKPSPQLSEVPITTLTPVTPVPIASSSRHSEVMLKSARFLSFLAAWGIGLLGVSLASILIKSLGVNLTSWFVKRLFGAVIGWVLNKLVVGFVIDKLVFLSCFSIDIIWSFSLIYRCYREINLISRGDSRSTESLMSNTLNMIQFGIADVLTVLMNPKYIIPIIKAGFKDDQQEQLPQQSEIPIIKAGFKDAQHEQLLKVLQQSKINGK